MTLQRPGKFDITDTAIAICALAPDAKILDVGCGDGTTVAYLRDQYGFDAEGVDIDEATISKAKAANPTLPISVADGGFLDEFLSLTFDCITMECSLSLIPMVEEALHEAWCLLKHGGKLVIHDLYDRSEANTDAGADAGDAGADDETKKRASEILKEIDTDEVYRRAEEWKREFEERITQAEDILQTTTGTETASGSDTEAPSDSDEIPDDDPGCHSCDDAHDAKHAGLGTVSDTLRDGLFVKDLLLTAMDDIGYHLLTFEDRTSDLESYAMEMIMAGDSPPACADGKKGVGYFMLVAEKPVK